MATMPVAAVATLALVQSWAGTDWTYSPPGVASPIYHAVFVGCEGAIWIGGRHQGRPVVIKITEAGEEEFILPLNWNSAHSGRITTLTSGPDCSIWAGGYTSDQFAASRPAPGEETVGVSTFHISSSGRVLSRLLLEDTGSTAPAAAAPLPDGGVAIARTLNWDNRIDLLDRDGNLSRFVTTGGPGEDIPSGLAHLAGRGYVLTGRLSRPGRGQEGFVQLFNEDFEPLGSPVRAGRHDGPSQAVDVSIHEEEQSVWVLGEQAGLGAPWATRIDLVTDRSAIAKFETRTMTPRALVALNDGGAVSVFQELDGYASREALLVRLDRDANILGEFRFTAEEGIQFDAIALTADEDAVIVAGSSGHRSTLGAGLVAKVSLEAISSSQER